MKKVLFVSIFLLSCFAAISQESIKVKIKGKILTSEGRAPKFAHIHYRDSQGKLSSFPADQNGNYEAMLPISGLLNFTVSALDHISITYTLFTQADDNYSVSPQKKGQEFNELNLDFTLSNNFIDKNSKEVGVIGSFNDFDFENPLPMTLQKDGTYSITIEKESDTLLYQLIGPFTYPEKRSVNGKQADFYTYDGGGDYRCGIITKDKKVKINYNPADFPKDMTPSIIKSSDKSISAYIAVKNEVEMMNSAFQDFMKPYYEDKTKNKSELIAYQQKILEKIQKLFNDYNFERTKKYLFFEYISTLNYAEMISPGEIQKDNDFISSFLRKTDTTDFIWKSKSYAIADIIGIMDNTETNNYFKSVSEHLTGYVKTRVSDQIKAIELVKMFGSKKEFDKAVKGYKKTGEPVFYQAMVYSDKKGLNKEKMFFYNKLIKDYPKSWSARSAKREYAPVKAVEIGKKCPNFKIADLDNPEIVYSPSYFKGKYVLIDIWATWCGPCIGELPSLHKAWEKYKGKNFEILSISFDDTAETPKSFRTKKWKMPWANAFTPNQFSSPIADAFEVTGIPRPVLVGPDGKIVAMEGEVRGSNLDKTLEKFLGKVND